MQEILPYYRGDNILHQGTTQEKYSEPVFPMNSTNNNSVIDVVTNKEFNLNIHFNDELNNDIYTYEEFYTIINDNIREKHNNCIDTYNGDYNTNYHFDEKNNTSIHSDVILFDAETGYCTELILDLILRKV